MPTLSADWALLQDGFAPNVLIEHTNGAITTITTGRAPDHTTGALLPGMVNLHSHAFQRSFAGRTEHTAGGTDFWTWREAMYQAANTITPDTMAPIAAYLAMHCLQGGFTSLVEFHYLQNALDGAPYAHRPAMAEAIIEGAQQAGIGLTMLFGIYQTGDFRTPLHPNQRRFRTDPQAALIMLSNAQPQQSATLRFGLAPHSLRAVPPASLNAITQGAASIDANCPIHIHAAEQHAENTACIASLGTTPVTWLLDNSPLNQHWCLIHATHTDAMERNRVAKTGATIGLCPSTEGNLGDGIFNLPDYTASEGTFGIGTDSHVTLDAFAELRLLEYTQRLHAQRRNVLASTTHSGQTLWQAACIGGAQAASRLVGAIRPGHRADFVVIEPTPETESLAPDFWLDAAIFAQDRAPAKHVMAGGDWLVRNGEHIRAREITQAYRRALARQASASF